jgi:hypothetical protein
MTGMKNEEKIKILKEQFAIPESEAWKWRVKVYEKGATGIGRLRLDELAEEAEYEMSKV